MLCSMLASEANLLTRTYAERLLLEDNFAEGTVGMSPETAGWKLDTSRGGSVWTLTKEGTCQIRHAQKPYSQDTLWRDVEFNPRYYLQFDARFEDHAGLSLVAKAGSGGAAFNGAGKTVFWRVLPNRKQGIGWQTVPRPVHAGYWHRFRILVDIEEKVQEFYVDDMSKPALREVGRDLRLQRAPRKPAAISVEFRDYGLIAQPAKNEIRNVRLVALVTGEQPPADSFESDQPSTATGPSPVQLWRTPGRAKSPHPQEPFHVDNSAELFLDDYLLAETTNLRRRLNKATPHPSNPILRPATDWENGEVATPCVLRIGEEFRMWYLARGWKYLSREGKASLADSCFVCYATSKNGVDWHRPTLGHHQYRGTRENNIVLRHEGSHLDSFSVFFHPEKEDAFRMLAFQGRWPYKESAIKAKGYEFKIKKHGHYPYRSQDGIHWQYMQDDLEPAWTWDRSSAAYDVRRDKYLGFWKTAYKGVRSRLYAESDDLLHWSTPVKSLTPEWIDNPGSRVDPAGTEFYGMVAFNFGNQYVGLLEILHSLSSTMNFQLIASRDLKAWNRLVAPEPFIDHGKEGSWNRGIMMMANSRPVLLDDHYWFFYEGANFDHAGPFGGDRTGKTRCLGASTLRKDRFISLLADDRSRKATLTTVPVLLDGTMLHLNANAPRGTVHVELLDLDGNVITGFSRNDCRPLQSKDTTDFAVVFNGKPRLPAEPVRVRFSLFNAELSAFWCE